MKKLFIYFLALVTSGSLFSACNYLDRTPEADGLSFDDVFKDSTNYRNYCEYLLLIPLIKYQQDGSRPFGTYDDITDNSLCTVTFGCASNFALAGDYYGMRTPAFCPMCNNATWGEMWKHIRVANTGIRNIHYYPGSEVTRNKILGMCYFYRGFTYMELCRRWGGMPYFYAPLDLSAPSLDYARLDMRETYVRAAQDLDSAALYLTNRIPDNEWQHPTRVAALAMKSRCLLYAASYQATNEGGQAREPMWEEAAKAANEALRAAEENGYGLVSMDDYYYLFKEERSDIYTREVLFGRRAKINWGSDAYLMTIRPPGQLGGKYGVAVNQLLADCYEMQSTGLPINDPESGYYEQNPYVDRDPRFYHDIMTNGQTVMGKKLEIWHKAQQADGSEPYSPGRDMRMDGSTVAQGYTRTGLYANKWCGRTFGAHLAQVWSYIRLSEVYLNFAEAANEAWSDPTAKQADMLYSAEGALNKVRNRAQMPNINEKFLNQTDFRERVRNERRIELCFEEHRTFDIRRWNIGPQTKEIWGVVITKLAPGYDATTYPTGFRYDRELYTTRVYEDRHNLFVIKLDDTNMGPLFTQNPGWNN